MYSAEPRQSSGGERRGGLRYSQTRSSVELRLGAFRSLVFFSYLVWDSVDIDSSSILVKIKHLGGCRLAEVRACYLPQFRGSVP